MHKFRILLAEVVGLSVLLGWLMWKYPELIEPIIPWVALGIAWHITWEFALDTKVCRGAAVAFEKRVNHMWIRWIVVFLIGGGISLLYWVGINKALARLASLAGTRTFAIGNVVGQPKNCQINLNNKPLQATPMPSEASDQQVSSEALAIVTTILNLQITDTNMATAALHARSGDPEAQERVCTILQEYETNLRLPSEAIRQTLLARLPVEERIASETEKIESSYRHPEDLQDLSIVSRDLLRLNEALEKHKGMQPAVLPTKQWIVPIPREVPFSDEVQKQLPKVALMPPE